MMLRLTAERKRAETVYLTSAQVAKALGISKRTLHNRIKAGKIPEPDVNPANHYYRWTLADLAAVQISLHEDQ